jgi:predicted Zn-dependent protease
MRSEKFRQLLESKGDNPLLRFSLGQALLEEDQVEEAIEELLRCAESNGDWLIPRLLLGKAYVLKKDATEARIWLSQAKELCLKQDHDEPMEEIHRLEEELEAL